MSSGSVYGPQPAELPLIAEDYAGRASISDPAHRFARAKLDAERRGKQSVKQGVKFVAARAFALVGPRLPLDGQFALGNFLGDALAGREIDITGDGAPIRSWMHAADLSAWCWTILARGTPGTSYNVGSEEAYSLWDAAHCVAALASPPVPVVRAEQPPADGLVSRYVPSVALARETLGLDVWIPFDEALRRTWAWYRA
jgi:dTDP-glucose 4,6-dehydratase